MRDEAPAQLSPVETTQLHDVAHVVWNRGLEYAPDGRRLLAIRRFPAESVPITVILNWRPPYE